MALPEQEAGKIKEIYLSGLHTILEYGLGGSTLLALSNPGNTVLGVDTDQKWIKSVSDEMDTDSMRSRFYPLHIDLGPTGPWGYPVAKDAINIKKFPSYALSPWEYARSLSLAPDVVLIDGRFRVACFLATLICSSSCPVILFDDYCDRPPYHVVEKILAPVETIGRLAVFKVGSPLDRRSMDLISEMWEYFLVPS